MSAPPAADAADAAPFREAVVDLGAVRDNVRTLARAVSPAHVMVVVKANGYGHGAVPVARSALAGGADWLGVADLHEGLQLRAARIDAPILAWLHDPGADFAPAIAGHLDLGASSLGQLSAIAAAAASVGTVAAVHLKLDTGLSRSGIPPEHWPETVARAAELEADGRIRVRGIFSHLANTSPDEDAVQLAAFERGLESAAAAGLRPELRHLASTAGALRLPASRFDLVRIGIGAYGIPPFGDGTTAAELGLRPAMTLRGRVAAVRRIPAGAGVSYGHIWRAARPTTVALVPLGYADGVPRQASGRAEVWLADARRPVIGRIAMDQFVVDVGDDRVETGDEVVLFGDPETGAPSADDWGDAADTIGYDIVTRIGPRVPKRYVGGE
ncbi:alanine racemase [Agromyces laixinhei]|uniref:alanine racemase n=1 Tax=Agromyces laixinhei TaxID=2585717 RepID=UPI0011168A8E|nr:alanine racemase [Agromyces laixinhei]